MKNYTSARDRILQMLEEGNWVTTMDLVQAGGTEGPRRLRELREFGYLIERRSIKDSNQWEYRLEGRIS